MLKEEHGAYLFDGTVQAFIYIHEGILHRRSVMKVKGHAEWTIHDELIHAPYGMAMRQLWHLPAERRAIVEISTVDIHKTFGQLTPIRQQGWVSGLYGQKTVSEEIIFSATESRNMETVIRIKD